MGRTVHETPVVKTLMHSLAWGILKSSGWKAAGEPPDVPKYVIIAAPHTSNWDFVYTMSLAFTLEIKPLIMMKAEWFKGPMAPFFRWLGAIPIDRSRSKNVVDQSIQAFNDCEEMVMIVPPSGTRKKMMYWKTGFYYIALGANVPIVLGYLDYRRKVGSIGPTFYPTGNLEADMKVIKEFYAGIEGKHPEMTSRIAQKE